MTIACYHERINFILCGCTLTQPSTSVNTQCKGTRYTRIPIKNLKFICANMSHSIPSNVYHEPTLLQRFSNHGPCRRSRPRSDCSDEFVSRGIRRLGTQHCPPLSAESSTAGGARQSICFVKTRSGECVLIPRTMITIQYTSFSTPCSVERFGT